MCTQRATADGAKASLSRSVSPRLFRCHCFFACLPTSFGRTALCCFTHSAVASAFRRALSLTGVSYSRCDLLQRMEDTQRVKYTVPDISGDPSKDKQMEKVMPLDSPHVKPKGKTANARGMY